MSETGLSKAEAEDNLDVFTEFETDDELCGGVSPDGEPYWGAYCPQPDCGHLNLFRGNPQEFAIRPYACSECGWVSLMHGSVAEIEVC